uniref:Uncharacterized protein n=1 Tax=Rhizophora mucronata TaxID=61149 RepID=A0A2P2N8E4_RHIMU
MLDMYGLLPLSLSACLYSCSCH